MERFKNILVGVDLSEADRFVSDKLGDPSEAAVQRALWLAKANSARVHCRMTAHQSVLRNE